MASPLPPRPNRPIQKENEKENEDEKEDEKEVKSNSRLTEHTLAEQQAGKDAVKLSKTRVEQEMEAGKKIVQQNEERRYRKA